MANKFTARNLYFHIVVLLIMIAFVIYYYNKYLQDKPIEWTLFFILGLVFIGYLSILLYKRKPSLWFSLVGLEFSVYWTALFFIFGFLLIFIGIILFIVYLYKDPIKLYRPILALLFGFASIITGIYYYKFGRKIAKTKIKSQK